MTDDFMKYNFHYSDEFQYLCMKNAFKQLLEYYGYENSNLYIRTGFELKIQTEKDTFGVFKQWPCYPFHDMRKVVSGNGKDFSEIFEKNCDEVPVIVLVDVYELPFRNEYHKFHAAHFIILFDYKSAEHQVGVVDWYAPHFFKGYIDYDAFKKARTSDNPTDTFTIFSGYSIDNYWFALKKDDELDSPENNYRLNVDSMIRVVDNPEAGIYSGLLAIQKIREYIDRWYDLDGKTVKRLAAYYHDQLFIYYRTTKLAGLYFNEVHQILNFEDALRYRDFAKSCEDVISRIIFTLNKCIVSCSEKKIDKIDELVQQLEKKYKEIM